ncbi:hypothetical protein EPN87_02015 [archaeon]|nr:MAG: hypothetical protein EPN87_02015 [archaeon]
MFATSLVRELKKTRHVDSTSACYSPVTEMEKEESRLYDEMNRRATRFRWRYFYLDEHSVNNKDGSSLYYVCYSTPKAKVAIPDPIRLLGKKRYCTEVRVRGNDFVRNERVRGFDLAVYPSGDIWTPGWVSSAMAEMITQLGYHADFVYSKDWATVRENMEPSEDDMM